jgi:holliday junction DNA helicase RuvA
MEWVTTSAISVNTYSQIKGKSDCRLLTHLVVREDAHILFGFAGEDEEFCSVIYISFRRWCQYRKVNFSSLTPGDVSEAIVNGKVGILQKVKGIGGKTAQRIIIDLKDKLVKDTGIKKFRVITQYRLREEALSALTLLGFNKALADKTIDKILQDEGSSIPVEQLIKSALKIM